jgi:xylulokinase
MYAIGIEFSTQSAKVIVLDLDDTKVAFTRSIDYDTCFPAYGTKGGVLPLPAQDVRHTSPFMLLEALDCLFDMMTAEGLDLSRVGAIKVDGMQHCTVYVDGSFSEGLKSLDAKGTLVGQLGPCITRKTSPIWEDRSPVAEAEYLTESLKDQGGIDSLTGNRAELRFPAAQILKWSHGSPKEYEQTSNIFILSAFVSAILAGKILPVDTGDGWGTNLNHLDIYHPGWSDSLVSVMEAFVERRGLHTPLMDKLGRMDHYDAPAGFINSYFVQKYGVSPRAKILIGTGDNPATLLGCGGHMVVSLGTSYTVNGVMAAIAPSADEEYNVFGFTRGKAMALSVFTNGAKVHETFLHRYLNIPLNQKPKPSDWSDYAREAGGLQLSSDENLMLPYLFDETVPLRKEGVIRDGFGEDDAKANVRALHLSQILTMKLHANHLGDVDELCIVGGASGNPVLRQWIADAFHARTYSIHNADSAAPFGCALSGAVTALGISYGEAAKRFIRKDRASMCDPNPENRDAMIHLVERYRKLEAASLRK